MLDSSLFIVEKGFYFTISLSSFFQVRHQKSFIQIRKQIWVKFHIKRMKKRQLICHAREKNIQMSEYHNIKPTYLQNRLSALVYVHLLPRFIRITNIRAFVVK